MRSLKIIIFRDTDKPYTIIIPSSILVTMAFIVLATFTLLTFSLVGNVMLYARTADKDPVAVQQQEQDSPQENELLYGEDQESPAGEETGDTGTVDDSQAETEEDLLASLDIVEEEPEGETPAGEGEDVLQGETEVAGTATGFSPEAFEIVDPMASAEAVLIEDPLVSQNSVSLRIQVTKFEDSGVVYRGKFVAALADEEGNVHATYPRGAEIEDGVVLNPEDGNTFRIRYRRNYSLTLSKQAGVDYGYVLLFIYDNDTNQLHWRKAIPLP